MNVAIVDETDKMPGEEKLRLRKIAVEILKLLSVPRKCELCVSFIDDREMRELNKRYRNINRTTDVLSFPQGEGPDYTLLGDVAISLETAERRSKAYGITIHEEINKLIVHGILHLLGYNHKKKKETDVMRQKEEELLMAVKDL